MNFCNLGKFEKEQFLMPIIIKMLQNLGGKATRAELKNEIKISASEIPEECIDEVRTSKNDRKYKPFDFTFNFSITHLEFAQFLTCPKRGKLQLTEKGIMCDLSNFDVAKDVLPLSEPEWERRIQKNKQSRLKVEDEDIEIENSENDDLDTGEQDWKTEVQNALLAMPPRKFELFCRTLVKEMGVDIDDTIGISATRDGGLDGYGYITSDDFRTTRVAIQAKRWNENQKVASQDIDRFRGAMDKFRAEFGIFITTADFSRDAINSAREGTRAITLISGDRLIELVEKYQVYIKPTYKLDPFYTETN